MLTVLHHIIFKATRGTLGKFSFHWKVEIGDCDFEKIMGNGTWNPCSFIHKLKLSLMLRLRTLNYVILLLTFLKNYILILGLVRFVFH